MKKRLARTALPLAAVLAAAPVFAQGTSEQRAACTGDAMRLCLSALPDVGRITSCMKAHYGELSPRCQASFNEGGRAAPPRKLAEEPRKPVEAKPETKVAEPRVVEPRIAEPKLAEPKPGEEKAPEKAAEIKPVEPKAASAQTAEGDRPIAKRAENQPLAPRARREAVRREPPQPRERVARMPVERDGDADEPRSSRATAPRRRRAIGEDTPRSFASRETPAPYERTLPERAPPYPAIAGGAVTTAAPPPPPVAAPRARGGGLAFLCSRGMIDAYTCGHTIPTLGLDE